MSVYIVDPTRIAEGCHLVLDRVVQTVDTGPSRVGLLVEVHVEKDDD